MSQFDYKPSYRRHLPHIQPPGATLFITFRLAGSIPAEILHQLIEEQERTEKRLAQIGDPNERARQADRERRRMFGKWDKVLDSAQCGHLWLRDERIATLVAESLHHLDNQRYTLEAFCIMPNHVHSVFTPLEKDDGTYYSMSGIQHSLKRYTALHANRILGRKGDFWQHENYDHVVRDEREFNRIVAYVLNNPVSAGLVSRPEEWKWSYCRTSL
jgi:REP element-mobilizing transposase RayT